MSEFKFLADDVFTIWNRGIVFRGKVVSGSISTGARVLIQSRNAELEATVGLISVDRNIVSTSITGSEVNLLLTDFERESINERIRLHADESDWDNVPSMECDLDIDLPVVLQIKGG
ncbi:hypothetical protein [Duganella sp. FT27W]|uniref:hypothetical protein n=1 Tax=Duganella sp. FT27W TaxID=2654636 RepID=UPI00128DE479|nr:hypothetical protein [Duganella sp. FT27W]MPQ58427.1 hypothetical protein [Duganella sp. FT27W]